MNAKRGIKRIPAAIGERPTVHARHALKYLRMALAHATAAGACYTAARIRAAISSAKGAERAAGYRENRHE